MEETGRERGRGNLGATSSPDMPAGLGLRERSVWCCWRNKVWMMAVVTGVAAGGVRSPGLGNAAAVGLHDAAFTCHEGTLPCCA